MGVNGREETNRGEGREQAERQRREEEKERGHLWA